MKLWVTAMLLVAAAAAVRAALASQAALEGEVAAAAPLDDFNSESGDALDDEEDGGSVPTPSDFEDSVGDLSDVGFDVEEEEEGNSAVAAGAAGAAGAGSPSEQQVLKALGDAMRRPGMRKKLGQVLPILRSMSPAQRLALASLLAARLAKGGAGGGDGGSDGSSAVTGAALDATQREELLLPLSQDIANMFQPEASAQELRQAPRAALAPSGRSSRPAAGRRNGLVIHRPPGPPKRIQRKRVQPKRAPPPLPPPPRRDLSPKMQQQRRPLAAPKQRGDLPAALPGPLATPGPVVASGGSDCEYFLNTLCVEVADYPNDAIMASIQRQQGALQALLAEFSPPRDKLQPTGRRALGRREDPAVSDQGSGPSLSGGGALCSSVVKYARPKRARATSGKWKYVVNVGDYTQTLRLEMCSKPNDACAFVSDNFRSACTQVFNYHRLLTWDETRGLHMDIFKVPSCCSCRVHGYAFQFPPPNRPTAPTETFPGHGAFGDGPKGGIGIGTGEHLDGDDFHPDGFGHGSPPQNFGHDPAFHGVFQENEFVHDAGGNLPPGVEFDDSGGFGRPLGSSSSFQETTLFHGAPRPVAGGSTRRGPRPPGPHPPHGPPPGALRPPPPLPGAGGVGALAPPPGPPLPLATGIGADVEDSFPPFAPHPNGNLIRRSRNQTSGPRFEQDLAEGASAPRPVPLPPPRAPHPLPPRRPNPLLINSDVIRTTTTTTRTPPPPPTRPSPPTRPPPPAPPTRPQPPPPVAVPNGGSSSSDNKRINYSYHPIIDFFQSQTEPIASRLEQRRGEEWTPIVGATARSLPAASVDGTTAA